VKDRAATEEFVVSEKRSVARCLCQIGGADWNDAPASTAGDQAKIRAEFISALR
jgi:hypothetical protein